MRFADETYNLRIELDTKNCELSPQELEKMTQGLAPLREPLRHFPVSDLYITVEFHAPSQDYHVKTSLVLSGRTLFTGDDDQEVYPAFHRCVRKLVGKLGGYKQNLGGNAELSKQQKGTHHDLIPDREPDTEILDRALEEQDYAAYREAMYVYEEPLRKRIGRWIARYPEIDGHLGDQLTLADIVEEVFLNSFERWESRPESLRIGDWLEHLIDPSIKALLKNPTAEMENISFARSLRGAVGEED